MKGHGLEIAHEVVYSFLMLSLGERSQVGVEGSRDDAFVTEVDLDLAEVLALFQQMSGVGMAKSVAMSILLDAAGE